MPYSNAPIHDADSRVEAPAPEGGSRPICHVDPGITSPVTRNDLQTVRAASAGAGGEVVAQVELKERVA